MKKLFLTTLAISLISMSCKKVKIDRLSLGEEKKMKITSLNKVVNTSFTEWSVSSGFENFQLDLDGDNIQDVSFSLKVWDERWVKNEGDQLPWDLKLKLLNPDFSIREIADSKKRHLTNFAEANVSPEGITIEVYNLSYSCFPVSGSTESSTSSYIFSGLSGSKFEEDNGVWSRDTNLLFIVAQSNEAIISRNEREESEDLIIQTTVTIERSCHSSDKTRPVLIQFKSDVDGGEDYKLGWIELVFSEGSFKITRHAITKKIVKV